MKPVFAVAVIQVILVAVSLWVFNSWQAVIISTIWSYVTLVFVAHYKGQKK